MGQIPSEILQRLLQADPEKLEQVDRLLKGELTPQTVSRTNAPLLMRMTEAAKLLGTSRTTIWRAISSGRLRKVEILPGSYRVRRADVEALAN